MEPSLNDDEVKEYLHEVLKEVKKEKVQNDNKLPLLTWQDTQTNKCEYRLICFSFDSTHDQYGPKNCVDNNSKVCRLNLMN